MPCKIDPGGYASSARAVKLEAQLVNAHKFLGNVYTVLGEEEEKVRREEVEAQRLQSDGRAPKR